MGLSMRFSYWLMYLCYVYPKESLSHDFTNVEIYHACFNLIHSFEALTPKKLRLELYSPTKWAKIGGKIVQKNPTYVPQRVLTHLKVLWSFPILHFFGGICPIVRLNVCILPLWIIFSKSLSVEFHRIIWIFQTEFSLTHEE